jgi:hypothetical protein
VLRDYSSKELDLSDPASFRDLAKPIGAQSAKQEAKFRERSQPSAIEETLKLQKRAWMCRANMAHISQERPCRKPNSEKGIIPPLSPKCFEWMLLQTGCEPQDLGYEPGLNAAAERIWHT